MKYILLIILSIIAVACQKAPYKYKSYDESAYRYANALDNKDIKKAIKGYKEIVEADKKGSKNQKTKNKIAPGMCIDYARLLLLQGDTTKAQTFFDKETHLFPESKTYVDNLRKDLGL